MEYNLEKFKETIKNWNIDLDDNQIQQFLQYYEMLVEKNKVMNLTAITEFDQVLEKHFLDSISLGTVINLHQKLKVIDLGTGAGFPGIPLKIAFPELQITLADSLNKRVIFLQEVIDALKLNHIEAVHGRAEELARNVMYREKYDICVSRAVANLATLSEYCLPFVSISGKSVSYKSGDILEEVNAAKRAIGILGGKVTDIPKFTFGEEELHRSFVIIEKVKKTPKTFPRKAGTPSKEPLA
jgi:16S rRNA (guanine527-N7)-methyltransferase